MSNNQSSFPQKDHNSSFLLGLFIGALVAALLAVLIHRHQKSKVVVELKKYFQDLIDRLLPSSNFKPAKSSSSPQPAPKIKVDIPQNIKTFSPVVAPKKTPVKTFVKPKK